MGDDNEVSLEDVLREEEYHERTNEAFDELERDWDEPYTPSVIDCEGEVRQEIDYSDY